MACLPRSLAAMAVRSMSFPPPTRPTASSAFACSSPLSLHALKPRGRGRVSPRVASLRVVSQQTDSAGEVGAPGVAAIAGGLVANPVVAWSLYTLKTTGCGLPPGPGGAIGALEGVSYLVVVATVAWSTYTKVRTGAGLPSGPSGLLGAVEGLAYLSLLAILVVFGLQYLDLGFIPGPVPSDMCFGSPS